MFRNLTFQGLHVTPRSKSTIAEEEIICDITLYISISQTKGVSSQGKGDELVKSCIGDIIGL